MYPKVVTSDSTTSETTISTPMDWSTLQPATMWCVGAYLLLSWIPFIGAVVSGVVGGIKARRLEVALVASFVPGVLSFTFLFILNILSPNLLAERWLLMLSYTVLTLVGAVIGVGIQTKWLKQ